MMLHEWLDPMAIRDKDSPTAPATGLCDRPEAQLLR